MKLIIRYKQTGGIAPPDGDIMRTAKSIVKTALDNKYPPLELSVSSEILVDAIRVLIFLGEIEFSQVVFLYEDKVIKPDKDGRLDKWPKGFCDIKENLLTILLKWD